MIHADPIITFNFKPYPTFPSAQYCHKVMQDLGHMSNSCRLGVLDQQLVAGIEVTYSGYLTVSDDLGEISFPHKPSKPVLTLLVTNRIAPVMMAGNTVHHWTIEKDSPAAFYQLSMEKDPLMQGTSYWNVKSLPLPADNAIPLQTIIILEDPQYIQMPLGATLAQESANFVLPDIYVKRGIDNHTQALYAIDIKHLFDGVHYLKKTEPLRSITLINP